MLSLNEGPPCLYTPPSVPVLSLNKSPLCPCMLSCMYMIFLGERLSTLHTNPCVPVPSPGVCFQPPKRPPACP